MRSDAHSRSFFRSGRRRNGRLFDCVPWRQTDQMFIPAKEEVILLPAKTRYEQDDGGTETSTERRIMFSPEIPRQVGEARAEWKVLRELAAAVHPERAQLLGCETGWKMREEIARVVPFYDGIQNLRETGDAIQYGGA